MKQDIEVELDILEHISQIDTSGNSVRQRDLATILGRSLGMTNAILKRLSAKGMLSMSRLNSRNLIYAITPEGTKALAARSYNYLKRTIKNVVDYKAAFERVVISFLDYVPDKSKSPLLLLLGNSDFDFIIEHVSYKHMCSYEIVKNEAALTAVLKEKGDSYRILVFVSEDKVGTYKFEQVKFEYIREILLV